MLTTSRLELRPFTHDLAERIAAGARDAGWAPDYPTAGDVVIARHVRGAALIEPWVPYQVTLRGSGTVIGGVGFHGPPTGDGTVEIGYGMAASAQRRGYATEAARALVELAWRSGAKRVIAHTDSDNLASQRVLAALGFELIRAEAGVEDGYLYLRELSSIEL